MMRIMSSAYLLLQISLLYWLCGNIDAFWPFTKSTTPSPKTTNSSLSPVILVPGDGGSQLDARLNKSESPFACYKTADWYNLWLNLELIVEPMVLCWVDNIRLYYDNVTRSTHNTPGVDIRVPNWGDPQVVEWIDPTKATAGAYFKDIGDMLVNYGYERKRNLFGAPYDFRKAPNEQQQFFMDLKKLVQDAYEMNNKSRVTFITHSMGSPLTLVFLQQQSVEWKDKYIKQQISLAGAWAGSVKAVKVFAMGDDLDSFLLNRKILRTEQITSPSTSWLLPSPLFWGSNEVLVETPTRQYTMGQLQQFFDDLGYPNGWEMRKDTMKYTLNFSPPDIELHCLYGDGVRTVARLYYKKSDIRDVTPSLIMGMGDGTVNRRSLMACHHWRDHQSKNITTLSLAGVNHMDILANRDVLNYISNVLFA